MISDKAEECPKCGCPIGQETEPLSNHSITSDEMVGDSEEHTSRKWLYVVISVLFVAVAGVGYWLYADAQSKKPWSVSNSYKTL